LSPMSEDQERAAPPLRADAVRSRSAILDAAVRVLNERPHASLAEVARSAGLTRQTIYAHFSSRDALLAAVVEQATIEALSGMDASSLDQLSPVDAMGRLLEIAWDLIRDYPLLLHLDAPGPPGSAIERHEPVLGRLEALIRRGQASGDFDDEVSSSWLAAATIGLGEAVGDEVRAGRMTVDDAPRVLRSSVLRVLGVVDAVTS